MTDENLPGSPESPELLQPTRMLDFQADNIRALVDRRGWRQQSRQEDAAHAVYEFCREEILFGYNSDADDMPASRVLAEGVGHCNTKATLLMALLRSVGIPCRLHAFTIHKNLQRGALTPFVYFMAPREIIHTWAEARLGNQWVALEGLILDSGYLEAVQHRFTHCTHPFLGYAVATADLQRPRVEWTGGDTFIQHDGIARELGIYKSPDEFYAKQGTNLRGIKGWLYRNYFYKRLNENISNIRGGFNHADNHDQQCSH
ncbi:MAG: transglutaminase domain-containing protein [Curvibacter sp.]|nr:transglutaminase domain-containing protein [Curvibacter sp.]